MTVNRSFSIFVPLSALDECLRASDSLSLSEIRRIQFSETAAVGDVAVDTEPGWGWAGRPRFLHSGGTAVPLSLGD